MDATAIDVKIVLEGDDSERRLDTADLRKSVTRLCREGDSAELHKKLEGISKDERQKLLNTKGDEGTTALHESCCRGKSECAKVLLRNGADAIIWDIRGFSPIHCAAYNGHMDTIDVLLGWEPPTIANMTKCEVDTVSQYEETALHIACLRGHLELAYFLVERDASLTAVDRDKNTVLHYAVASNNGKLLTWLLSMAEVKDMIGATNKFKQTVAHRAAVLGCLMSVSILVHSNADFNVKDKDGRSATDLARLLSNRQCYEIASKKKAPLAKPESPFIPRAIFSVNSSDTLPILVPQRSVSNGSSTSPATGSPLSLRRRGSMTRRTRPISQYVSRTGSFQSQDLNPGGSFEPGHRRSFSSRGSLQTLGSLAGYGPLTGKDSIASIATLRGSTDNFRYTSKETLTVVRENEKTKQKSKSLQDMEMKLLFASTYEPPPDLHFIPPLECDKLTPDNNQLYSKYHDIILRIPGEHWEASKSKEVEVRVCATVGLNQYPENYIIVSPICFISCKSEDKEVVVKMRLPHAASIKAPEYERKICILSTMSTVRSKNPNTPLSTPTDRKLHSIDVIDQELGIGEVHFKLKLLHPALFAVAVTNTPTSEVPRPIPIPLRSALYVLYKVYDGTSSLTRVFVHAYVALRLKTVDTDMKDIAKQEGLEVEYSGFELNSPSVEVTASLRNPRNTWEIEPLDSGLFGYNQIALTSQALDHAQSSNTYSHDHPYPLRQRFFIGPTEHARGAVKCEVIVSDTLTPRQKLTSTVVIPYSPTSKDATPEPSSRSSTRPPSPTNSRLHVRLAAPSESGSLTLSHTSESVV